MPLLVLAALAAIIGYVGYTESAKIEKRFRRGPLGIRAWQWGVGAAVVGVIIAIPASALVVGTFVGYVGYDETSKYERQHGNDPFGVPSYGWAAVCFSFGTIGALYGLNAHIIDRKQFSLLVGVVGLSAIVPTAIAQRFYQPGAEEQRDLTAPVAPAKPMWDSACAANEDPRSTTK